jgi:hypothetical protein
VISRLRFRSWLGLVVAAGAALRAWPLLGSEGHWGWPVFYDEGVYTAAALLFFQGAQPYRDFLLAHPPGVVYVLQPAAALAALTDPSLGFAAARWMAVGAGAANIALTGLLARAATGSAMGGLVAALLYAVHPEAMHAERGPNLEPLVTLPCLAAALLRSSASPRRTTTSGVLLGLALSIKTWAVLWWVACLVGAPDEQQQRRSAVRVLATALVSVSVLVLPLALAAPAEFWEGVVQFHATRPPDGVLESYRRPIYMAAHGRTVAALLAFAGFGLAAARWRARSLSPAERLVATAYGLTFAAFLASPTYWPHYNASSPHPSVCWPLRRSGASSTGRRAGDGCWRRRSWSATSFTPKAGGWRSQPTRGPGPPW